MRPLTPRRRGRLLYGLAALPLGVALMPQGGIFAAFGPTAGVLILVFLILSLSVHEAAHAWVASLCGDTTAKDMGRMTLNPIPHIDPVMTILLPAMMMMTSPFIFGGAKPVPVLFSRLRRPWRDMMFVALAGPASNVLLAIVFSVILKAMRDFQVWNRDDLGTIVLVYSVQLNIILAIFNMIPVPPLDGSRVMAWILPESMRPGYVALERFGLMLVVLLLFTGVFQVVYENTAPPLHQFVDYVVTLGGAW